MSRSVGRSSGPPSTALTSRRRGRCRRLRGDDGGRGRRRGGLVSSSSSPHAASSATVAVSSASAGATRRNASRRRDIGQLITNDSPNAFSFAGSNPYHACTFGPTSSRSSQLRSPEWKHRRRRTQSLRVSMTVFRTRFMRRGVRRPHAGRGVQRAGPDRPVGVVEPRASGCDRGRTRHRRRRRDPDPDPRPAPARRGRVRPPAAGRLCRRDRLPAGRRRHLRREGAGRR